MVDRQTTARIRRDITRRDDNQPFTTRDMLVYGERATVDFALFRMVRSGFIRRLARGVFVKATCQRNFECFEIATIKAKAFGKRILRQDHRRALSGLAIADDLREEVFMVDGRSSSFQYGPHRIVLKSALARKFTLGDTLAGCALRLLWQRGHTDESWIASARRRLGGQSRADVHKLLPLLPEWLHSEFLPCEVSDRLPVWFKDWPMIPDRF